MRLAKTIWPKFAADPGNSGRVETKGPRDATALIHIEIQEGGGPRGATGLVVPEPGFVTVTSGGSINRVSLRGAIAWSVKLMSAGTCSAPLALTNGRTLVQEPDAIVVLDDSGNVLTTYPVDFPLDDSGLAPSLTYDGRLVTTDPVGDVRVLENETWRHLGNFGLDVPPPAVYRDNSLAITAYDADGLCRIGLDSGRKIWCGGRMNEDSIACLSSAGVAAVSACDEEESTFYDVDGQVEGHYPHAALFSEHPEGWVAVSLDDVALLTRSGAVRWRHPSPRDSEARLVPAIVDGDGFVYVLTQAGMLCLCSDGQVRFEIETEIVTPTSIAMVSPGRVGFCSNRLTIVG